MAKASSPFDFELHSDTDDDFYEAFRDDSKKENETGTEDNDDDEELDVVGIDAEASEPLTEPSIDFSHASMNRQLSKVTSCKVSSLSQTQNSF